MFRYGAGQVQSQSNIGADGTPPPTTVVAHKTIDVPTLKGPAVVNHNNEQAIDDDNTNQGAPCPLKGGLECTH